MANFFLSNLLFYKYWNLVDCPSVVFPAGQHHASTFKSSPDYPRHMPRNQTEEYITAQWDPEVYDNAHIGLQLVGRRLNEEKLLGTLKVVEAAVEAYDRERKSKHAIFGR
jgi:amidase